MTISPNYVGHLEKVFSNVRQKLGRQPKDDVNDDLANIHLRDNEGGGTSRTRLSRQFTHHQEHGLRENQTFFDTSQKLILDQSREIYGISTMDWNTIPWMRNPLLNDRAVKLSTAKVFVFSDSVLCLDKINECPRSINSWKDKTEWLTQCSEYRELDRIDGEPVVFEWKNFPGHTTLQLLWEIQRTMEEKKFLPEQSDDWIIFMSMFNDNDWRKAETMSFVSGIL